MDERQAAAMLAAMPEPLRQRVLDMIAGAAASLGVLYPMPRQLKRRGPDPLYIDFARGDADLLAALIAYEDMRKQIKRPLTPQARKLALTKLAKLSSRPRVQQAILEQSVFNSWLGLFPLKGSAAQDKQRAVMDDLRALHAQYAQEERP